MKKPDEIILFERFVPKIGIKPQCARWDSNGIDNQ